MPEVSGAAEEGIAYVPALSRAQLPQNMYLQIMDLWQP